MHIVGICCLHACMGDANCRHPAQLRERSACIQLHRMACLSPALVSNLPTGVAEPCILQRQVQSLRITTSYPEPNLLCLPTLGPQPPKLCKCRIQQFHNCSVGQLVELHERLATAVMNCLCVDHGAADMCWTACLTSVRMLHCCCWHAGSSLRTGLGQQERMHCSALKLQPQAGD